MKHLTRSIVLAAASTLALLTGSANAAGLLIADGGFGGTLAIKEQDVKVVINNGVAVTTVDQVFQNTENRVVEALYTFPVPKGASVSNFSMWINGKEMVGEVVEKKLARKIYESYKQTRKDPGLLEQVDYRTFEMRIFPIQANAEQHVEITYCQELDFDHDRATYVYPLATTTRPNADTKVQGKFAVSVDVKSEIPIVDFESPSNSDDFVFAKHDQHYVQASMEKQSGDLSRDVVLSFQTSRPRTGLDLITSKPDGEDGYFSLTLTPGEELKAMDTPMDYVFVLDVSGSMNEEGKLPTSQRALGEFISALGPNDRFEVMTFNVQPKPLFSKLMTADDASKAKAQTFLDSQQAAGGTVLKNAMGTAYKYASDRPLNVIVLSDGLTEQTERQTLLNLITQRPKETRVFAIGVGNDVNRGLLEQMTGTTGGLAAFVSKNDNMQRQAQAFRRKLLRPIATDVAIHISGVDTYDLQPAKLSNLYYGSPVRIYGRYKGSGAAKVTVKGNIQGTPLEQSVSMDFPKSDDSNPQIERMWAWKKIDALLKQGDAAGSRQPFIDEIVLLGEGYSIATEYTSFLVLENDAEYQRWKIEQRNAVRMKRDRQSQQRVQTALEKLRDSATADLGPAGAEKMKAPATAVPTPVTPMASATPAVSPAPSPAPAPANEPRRSRGVDLPLPSFPSGGGGGAIDAKSAMLIIGGVALAAVVRFRKLLFRPQIRA